jgi:hypothetical protein
MDGATKIKVFTKIVRPILKAGSIYCVGIGCALDMKRLSPSKPGFAFFRSTNFAIIVVYLIAQRHMI